MGSFCSVPSSEESALLPVSEARIAFSRSRRSRYCSLKPREDLALHIHTL